MRTACATCATCATFVKSERAYLSRRLFSLQAVFRVCLYLLQPYHLTQLPPTKPAMPPGHATRLCQMSACRARPVRPVRPVWTYFVFVFRVTPHVGDGVFHDVSVQLGYANLDCAAWPCQLAFLLGRAALATVYEKPAILAVYASTLSCDRHETVHCAVQHHTLVMLPRLAAWLC